MLLSNLKFVLFSICVFVDLHSSYGTEYVPKNVSIRAVIAFGDSFVDSGNNNYITTLGRANFPPYGKDFVDGKPTGRFSNGKTLADTIATELGVKEYLPAYLDPLVQDEDLLTGVSFASGGAGYDSLSTKVASAISLSSQLDMFKEYIGKLKKNVGEEEANNIIIDSLFLLVASTNDLLDYFYVPVRSLEYDVHAYDNTLVELAMNFTQEIHKLGARRIAVFGAPPLGCFPALRTISGGGDRNCVDKLNKGAQLFNDMLNQQLPFLHDILPNSRVAVVDFYNPLINIIDNPHQYGLEVTDKGCCGTGDIEVTFLCNKLSPTCPDDSKYFFWDSIHLSEKGYHIFVNHVLPDLVTNLF